MGKHRFTRKDLERFSPAARAAVEAQLPPEEAPAHPKRGAWTPIEDNEALTLRLRAVRVALEQDTVIRKGLVCMTPSTFAALLKLVDI